jgi:hypothetical protein
MTTVGRMELVVYVVLALFVAYLIFSLNLFRREK